MESDLGFEFIQKELYRILPRLCTIEKEILILRFGLENQQAKGLKDIADKLNIKIYQIREAEKHTLSLIRHPSRSQVLEQYLYNDIFETDDYDDVVKIISRLPTNEIFFTDFEDFFGKIFTIKSDEMSITGVNIERDFVTKYFESKYGHVFHSEKLLSKHLYENLCAGYFSWSSEFDFLINLTIDKWIEEDPGAINSNLADELLWMDKVGFAIALISNILNIDSLDLAITYLVSAPRENYLTGQLSSEARAMLDLPLVMQEFLSRSVQVGKSLAPHIAKASDQYAVDFGQLSRDSEARVLFFYADLIKTTFGYARWRCDFNSSDY